MRIREGVFAAMVIDAERFDAMNIRALETVYVLTLDLRDVKEAVKILQDRNKHLEALSQSQAEALDMMEKGRL